MHQHICRFGQGQGKTRVLESGLHDQAAMKAALGKYPFADPRGLIRLRRGTVLRPSHGVRQEDRSNRKHNTPTSCVTRLLDGWDGQWA